MFSKASERFSQDFKLYSLTVTAAKAAFHVFNQHLLVCLAGPAEYLLTQPLDHLHQEAAFNTVQKFPVMLVSPMNATIHH